MPDPTDRVAQAIHAYSRETAGIHGDVLEAWDDMTDAGRDYYRGAARAVMARPGIAVVELPEADPNGLFWFRENCYVYVDPEDALIMTQRGTTHGTAGEARETAAALLAAADAAEQKTK